MSRKPIFAATHPRACSSAFERVFLTRRDIRVFHEPFGEPWYHGKERMATRYEGDEAARLASGSSNDTYKTVFDQIFEADAEGKRLFLKDMAQYLLPPDGKPASIAPSLVSYKRGVGTTDADTSATNGDVCAGNGQANGCGATNGDTNKGTHAPYPYPTSAEPGNPTVVPETLLKEFHFTFLIRHPRSSIPSYFRCTVPPLDSITGFANFDPSEAGYVELVRLFDYLRSIGHVVCSSSTPTPNGPTTTTTNNNNNNNNGVAICVLDADDMLDEPDATLRAYCASVGLDYSPDMLSWDTEEEQRIARRQFDKWPGFHDDALASTGLRKRENKHAKTDAELFSEWRAKFGDEAARLIADTVEENTPHYEHLKRFAIRT